MSLSFCKTYIRDRVFKLSDSLNSMKVLFHLGKTPILMPTNWNACNDVMEFHKMSLYTVYITTNHRQTGVNVLGLLNRFSTSSLKCWTLIFFVSMPVKVKHQLKSLYNSRFKHSHSHPIHTCFPMIASNDALISPFNWGIL